MRGDPMGIHQTYQIARNLGLGAIIATISACAPAREPTPHDYAQTRPAPAICRTADFAGIQMNRYNDNLWLPADGSVRLADEFWPQKHNDTLEAVFTYTHKEPGRPVTVSIYRGGERAMHEQAEATTMQSWHKHDPFAILMYHGEPRSLEDGLTNYRDCD